MPPIPLTLSIPSEALPPGPPGAGVGIVPNTVGDGVTDDAPAIQEAINSAGGAGATVFLPTGRYALGSKLTIPPGNSKNIGLRGAGLWNAALIRKPTYPAGNLIEIDGANGGGTATLISGLRIENANGFHNPSGAAIKVKDIYDVTLRDVFIYDGWRGIELDGETSVQSVTIDNCRYMQTWQYAANYPSDAGLLIAGHSTGVQVSNSYFEGQNADSPNNLMSGVRVTGADGVQFVNGGARGKHCFEFIGGPGYSIDDVYVSNAILDTGSITGVRFIGSVDPGRVYTNIRFVGCHINVGSRPGGQDNVQIGGSVDEVQFLGGNVNLGHGSGFVCLGGLNYNSTPKRSIQIIGVEISENNLSNTPGLGGVVVADGAQGIMVSQSVIRNRTAGHQKYGLILGNNLQNCMFVNNQLLGNESGGLYRGTGYTNVVIEGNNPNA